MIKLCAFSDEAASDLLGQIAALKENGISLMEIRGVNGKNISALTKEETKETAQILKEEGIGVWSIGSPLGKVDITVDFQSCAEVIKDICEKANILNADMVRVFSFYHAYKNREQVGEYLTKMTEIASLYGVQCCHENEKDIYGDTVERTIELLDRVPALQSVYDPANFLQVGEAAETSLDALHGRAAYFHIKDVIASTGELVPAGYGDGKIDELISRIRGDAVLTLEPHLRVFEGFAAIDGSEMKNKFRFSSNREAFDAAVQALKNLLTKAGYQKVKGGYEKL